MLHRVLVCGGRDYGDRTRVWQVLDHYLAESGGFAVVIHGAARGADSLAAEWAEKHGIATEPYPVTGAEWQTFGRSAGHRRNSTMLREGKPTVVVAFPGGNGTRGMMKLARAHGVPVLEIVA